MNGRTWALTAALTATLVGCTPTTHAAPSVHDCSRLVVAYMETHNGDASNMPEPAVCKALTAEQMHMVSVVLDSYVNGVK